MHGYYTYDHGPDLLGWLIFALLVALIVFGVVVALSRLPRGQAPHAYLPAAGPVPPEEPLAVLRLRYARGEISRDEYFQASTDLGATPPPSG